MNHVIGLLCACLVIGTSCVGSGQVHVGDIELWLPPGAVTVAVPVRRPGEQVVNFWVTAKPVTLSESIVAYCNAQGLRQDEIRTWAQLPSGIVQEPGIAHRTVRRWRGSWKDSQGNTISYSLDTQADDLEAEAHVAGVRVVVPLEAE